ncbi:MAG TPA: hypothetical protein VFZ53_19485 [Polyangiaceae bacterium]
MRFSSLIGCALVALACSKQEPALYASSAGEASYAERYPAMLASLRNGHFEAEKQAYTLSGEFSKYPDELKDPSWAHVETVVEKADSAGKGADYAAGMGESQAVRTFYTEERDVLRQKVGGSAEHAAKEKNCDVELYGPVGGALDRSVDQQLEERLRERTAAHRAIEDNEDALGKANVEKLAKQADTIAFTSYLVHVRLPQTKREIDARVADASEVKSTLDRTQEESKSVLDDPNASKNAKERAQKRADAARTAQASLDSEVEQAKKLGEELEQRTKAAQDQYEKAKDALVQSIQERQKAQGAKK